MSQSKHLKGLSIVVPVLNEAGNISELIKRIDSSVKKTKLPYEVIMIDDHSVDATKKEIEAAAKNYPVKYFMKKGISGKAQSLLEGFSYAKYDILCMIDSDLQYPPESIPEMFKKIDDGFDVVVAERKELRSNEIRKLFSRGFNFIFCRMLHGLKHDVQSGLKMFRREIIERISLRPLPWSFDLEFLLSAQAGGYKITGVDIIFEKRVNGKSKVNLLKVAYQTGFSAIQLKGQNNNIIPFHEEKSKKVGQGFNYKNVEFIHFSDLHITDSAVKTFLFHQLLFIEAFVALIAFGLFINFNVTVVTIMAVITTIYFADLLFNLLLIIRSFVKAPEIKVSAAEIAQIKEWPKYTIFCPLYKEWIVVPQFVKAINDLDYPKNKLQVQILLEADDIESIENIKKYKLPSYFEVIVVPNTLPKTKPKACNYGLKFATGEYAVIYDAEDIPDVLQLKKAVIAFKKSPPNIACIQAKLNYYNHDQNLLTRLFTAEYSLWFDLILTGLQSIQAPIPLGGTSNHFRIEKLREVKGWDSFNVTEDCDLGIRLAKHGYNTSIVDSVTLEEANSNFGNWINQRSRWIKGYMQTYLVHMRNPRKLLRGKFKPHFLTFQLVVGGKILSLFINPIMWLTTILYFVLRAQVGPTIEKFFPGPIFYIGVFSLVVGNFLYMYYYMIGCIQRKQYDLIKYVFIIPLYWLAMSYAAWQGFIELIFKPHYWPKTKHGLHLKTITQTSAPIISDVGMIPSVSPVLLTDKFKKIFLSGGMLVVAGVIANFLSYLYNGYLTRTIGIGDFGMISLMGNFLFLSVIPLDSLASSITYKSAFYLGKYQTPLTAFWGKIRYFAFFGGTFIMGIWLLLIPWLTHFFQASNNIPFVIFTPIWLFSTVLAVDTGFISGNQKFNFMAIIIILEPLIKIISAYLLVTTGNAQYVYAAIPASIIIASTFAFIFAKIIASPKNQKITDKNSMKFPMQFFFTSALTKFSIVSYLSLDLLIAKHFLTPTQAGEYALISLTGKMIFFIGGLFSQFIVPIVSKEFGENGRKNATFTIIFFASALSSLFAYILIGIFGNITGPLLLGNKILPVVHLLPIYGLGMLSFSITSSIISFHLIKKSYLFPAVSFVIAAIQLVASYFFHSSPTEIVNVMAIVGVSGLIITLILHLFEESLQMFAQNIFDLLIILNPLPKKVEVQSDKLKILIFNWRDSKHVWAGGAEVYVEEIAKKIVAKGHSVTIFCGSDRRSKKYEEVNGINVIRRGGLYTVYMWAFLYYMLKLRGKFDVIIDSENGIPFFTPLYVRKPIIGLIHHVHQEVFRESLFKPFADLACFLEAKVMPYVYKNTKMITVSNSTKDAMKIIGFAKHDVHIIHPGIESALFKPSKKTKNPTILYLGRLKPYKSIDVIIKAIPQIVFNHPDAKLIIAGFGESREELEKLVYTLSLDKYVTFVGKVTEEIKRKLLAESWVFAYPSYMEGWGISAIEANASGTPVVASNVPGLRDSVNNLHTGFLVTYGSEDEFADKINLIIDNNKLRHDMEKSSLDWSKKFSWDESANSLLEIIQKEL